MRILFTRFPLESAHGGAENQTLWLAAGLRDRGHEVSFLGSCPVLLQTFSSSGFPAITLDIGQPPVTKFNALSFLWRRTKMQQKLQKAIDAMPKPFDAVFMLSFSEKLLLTSWLRRKGIKVFWIEHDRIGRWMTKNPWLPALKKSAKDAMIICVSELSRRLMIHVGFDEERVIAIPNGVPIAPPTFPRPFSREMRVGCIARFSPEKGIDILIQAVNDLPNITLSIVGTGSEEGYLRTLITQDAERMGTNRIHLLSSVENLDAFYEEIDVLILPSSDHDPFGLVAAEAMMRGIPVIVTDACGIAEYLKNGEDILVAKAGDPRSLSVCIQRLLDPEAKASLGKRGQEAARERFSLATMIDAYEQYLQKEAKTP
jgi:glycosyltransferase involved in cell wall biosynthesis